jgi:hypothetical protein
MRQVGTARRAVRAVLAAAEGIDGFAQQQLPQHAAKGGGDRQVAMA